MTFRQIFLKAVYPLVMLRNKLFRHDKSVQVNRKQKSPPVSFYSLRVKGNNGNPIDLSTLRGKKILLVNTASNCGFTAQYGELETLYQQHDDTLVIIGFPADDFKHQEPLDDTGIAEFCKLNFGVTFPLAAKSQVIKGAEQHSVFYWLTHQSENGWCNQQPVWNFCKYLIDEEGRLMAFFAHTVSPLSKEVVGMI